MTMPTYNLDDRRWADLIDEGRALIPLYAPEWTDHNVHDPGITLMELFAWIAEMNIYRLNRITVAERRKFLTLVDVRPKPPRAARSIVSLAVKDGQAPLPLPAGLEFEGTNRMGVPVRVRALDVVTVIDARLSAVQVGAAGRFADMTDRWAQGEPFPLFGADPAPGAALYLGFNNPLPQGVPISLAFQGFTKPAPPRVLDRLVYTLTDVEASGVEREAVVEEVRAVADACPRPGFAALCGEAVQEPQPARSEQAIPVPPHHSVVLAWEYLDPSCRWLPVQTPMEDSTRAFTLDGQIVLTLSGTMGSKALGHVPDGYFYLRCRLVAGAYDAAPTLLFLGLNSVAVEQAAEVEYADKGTGWPEQVVAFAKGPVAAASVRVYSDEDGVRYSWQLRSDLDGSGPADRHAVLDAARGTITFGTGAHGWVPPPGAVISVGYLSTMAENGNAPAATIQMLSNSSRNLALLGSPWVAASTVGLTGPILAVSAVVADSAALSQTALQFAKVALKTITNPIALTGGAAAETLEHAEGRAFGLAEKTTRAVTLSDYETLAFATPGVQLARAKAMANVHPYFPCIRAPGVITLILVPFLPLGRPSPSAGLIQIVAGCLGRHRVIGTRIEVIGPNYVEVAVIANVQALPGVRTADLPGRIAAALDLFFDPLAGGPAGQGWPFGRDVVRAEVLATIAGTAGVDHVVSLTLTVNGGPPQCGNVCIGFAGLVATGTHQVTVMGTS